MSRPSPDAAQCAARLRSSVARISRRLRANAPADGVGVAKLSVLGQLHRLGPLTPTQLATLERVRLQSLTRLLAELQSEGWVMRKPSTADRRQTVLSLSRKGLQRLRANAGRGEAFLEQAITTTLEKSQRAALLEACALLDALADALSAGDAGVPDKAAAAYRPAARLNPP